MKVGLLPARHRAKAVRLSAAFALVALGSATALSEGVLQSSVAAAVQSARDLIADRSPGLRTRADMNKGKPRMAAVAPDRTARALPRVRDARAATDAPIAAPAEETLAPFAVADTAPGVIVPAGGVPGAGSVPGAVGGPILFSPVPGPGIIGGGPVGGVILPRPEPTPTPTPTPPVVVPPPAPVPEPASWATMLLGFFAVGWALRRRTRDQAVA